MNYPLYHHELNPELWDKSDGESYTLKPEVRQVLQKVADDFVSEYLREASVSVSIKDTIIVGSATNYNWTKFSDIDLHVVVDYAELDMSAKDAGTLLTAIKINWNKSHDISIKGHDIELYVQGVDQPAESVSVFSVLHNKWLKPPQKENPKFDKPAIIAKHKKWKKKIDSLLENPNEAVLRKTLEKLYDFRQLGLDSKAGEFSPENVVFKILRAQGYLDKIKDCAAKIYDKEMTLNERLDALQRECVSLLTEVQASASNFNRFKQVYGVDWSDDELKKLFLRFTNQSSRMKEKDIFKYGKLSGLQAVLDEPSKHEKTKAIKNDNVNILLNNENVLVVEPLSMEASILYGKNTKWCTASTRLPKNPFSGEQEDDENGEDDDEEITNRFYTYFKGVTLVYFIDKKTHEKFAIAKHPNEKTSEAFDETDKKIKAEEILSRFGLDWSIFDNAVKKEEKPKIMQHLQDAAAAKKVDDERQKIMAQVETDASGKRFIAGDLVIYFHKKFPDMEDVEVRGRVLCRFIESLEGCPKKVMGDFNCSNSKITTLQGGPRYVGGKFDCSYTNNITTLEGAPDSVGGDFRAHNIFLKFLNGAPRKVGGNYEVSGTFTTLEGGPEEVGGNFKTINCHKLTSIQGAPRIVSGNFYFYDNGKDYTEEEIRAVSKVAGKVFVDRNYYLKHLSRPAGT